GDATARPVEGPGCLKIGYFAPVQSRTGVGPHDGAALLHFTIGVPMDPLSPSTYPASPAPTTASTRCQVLIVDDSPMDRHLAGAIVNKVDGWSAVFASHGKEALELMQRQAPDVVLTDLLMPEMDGLELTQAVRARFPNLPVILMTAHGSEDIAIQALQ